MKINLFLHQMFNKVNMFHVGCAVIFLLLFSIGYGNWANEPIAPEIAQRIKNDSPVEAQELEYNKLQLMYMQERGWFYILFSTLAISIVIWIGLTNRKEKRRTYIEYSYRVSERWSQNISEHFNFKERLKLKYVTMTANDLLVAEMLVDGLSSKEIALELNISATSANTARYRLRKRMGLSPNADLLDELKKI